MPGKDKTSYTCELQKLCHKKKYDQPVYILVDGSPNGGSGTCSDVLPYVYQAEIHVKIGNDLLVIARETSDQCFSKKKARKNVAKKLLDILQSAEEKVITDLVKPVIKKERYITLRNHNQRIIFLVDNTTHPNFIDEFFNWYKVYTSHKFEFVLYTLPGETTQLDRTIHQPKGGVCNVRVATVNTYERMSIYFRMMSGLYSLDSVKYNNNIGGVSDNIKVIIVSSSPMVNVMLKEFSIISIQPQVYCHDGTAVGRLLPGIFQEI